jgi:hypothetical protein
LWARRIDGAAPTIPVRVITSPARGPFILQETRPGNATQPAGEGQPNDQEVGYGAAITANTAKALSQPADFPYSVTGVEPQNLYIGVFRSSGGGNGRTVSAASVPRITEIREYSSETAGSGNRRP